MRQKPTVKLLDSGYWHVRFSGHQFIQFPKGTTPDREHCFGWISNEQLHIAERLTCDLASRIDPPLHQEPIIYTTNRRRNRVKCACRFTVESPATEHAAKLARKYAFSGKLRSVSRGRPARSLPESESDQCSKTGKSSPIPAN